MDALKNYDGSCFYSLHYWGSLVGSKAVAWNQSVFSLEQFIYFFECHVEVNCIWVIKIVQVRIIVVFLPK